MQTAADGQWMEGPLREELPRDTQDGASAKGRRGSQSSRFLMLKGQPRPWTPCQGSLQKAPVLQNNLCSHRRLWTSLCYR